MRKKRQLWFSLLAPFIVVLASEPAVLAQSAASLLKKYEGLSRQEREQKLIEGAKKEGRISWYTTLIVDQVVRPVKEAFEKEYPFIQIEFFRGNAERLVQKMFAEYQAKRYDVDIIDGTVSPTIDS